MTLIHAWRPDLDAAAHALAGRARIDDNDLAQYPRMRAELVDDARAVLDASGANDEIQRLRAVLYASHSVLAHLRDECRRYYPVTVALLLGPLLDEQPSGHREHTTEGETQ